MKPEAAFWMAYAAFLAAGMAAAFAIMGLFFPPKHCRYMVVVTNHPGVYECSGSSHVKARP